MDPDNVSNPAKVGDQDLEASGEIMVLADVHFILLIEGVILKIDYDQSLPRLELWSLYVG